VRNRVGPISFLQKMVCEWAMQRTLLARLLWQTANSGAKCVRVLVGMEENNVKRDAIWGSNSFKNESDGEKMRRAWYDGVPSIFVSKNGLGRCPEFRDQGVEVQILSPRPYLSDFNNLRATVASSTSS